MAQPKHIVWLHGDIKSPPFSLAGRMECGALLRRLQNGEALILPHSRPMPSIGARVHELRVVEPNSSWRIVYRLEPDAIVILDVFPKSTKQMPQQIIETCRDRLSRYLSATRKGK